MVVDIIAHVVILVVIIIFPHANATLETGADGRRRYRRRDGQFISEKQHRVRMTIFYAVIGSLYLFSIYKNFIQ